jgi:hypothetical protein
MKQINIFIALMIFALFTACKNDEWEFPDYDYSTVYFSYQYPVRTITLGEDNLVNTDLDNEHKCKIMATLAGVYSNDRDVRIDFVVDNSLAGNVTFEDGNAVRPMPASYYALSSNQLVIPKGSITGGVTVQLTDAFFADPDAIRNTYVIPLVMTQVAGADSILKGRPIVDNPNRLKGAADYDVLPKDYILYAVKYINPWHADYLRRGTDIVTEDGGAAQTLVRHAQYVERNEVCRLSTFSFNALQFPVANYKSKSGAGLDFNLKLDFDAEQKCTVAPFETAYQLNDNVRVYDITASGSGKFVKRGEKNSWGNQDRDALYLDYAVTYKVETNFGGIVDVQAMEYSTKDTLVVRDRGVIMETFIPVKSN